MALQMRKPVLLCMVRNRPIHRIGRNKRLGAVDMLKAAELINEKFRLFLRTLDEQDFFVFLKNGFQRRDVRVAIHLQYVLGWHQQADHLVELLSRPKDDQRVKMLWRKIVG